MSPICKLNLHLDYCNSWRNLLKGFVMRVNSYRLLYLLFYHVSTLLCAFDFSILLFYFMRVPSKGSQLLEKRPRSVILILPCHDRHLSHSNGHF